MLKPYSSGRPAIGVLLLVFLAPLTAGANPLNELQSGISSGTAHATAQIGGLMGLFLMCSALGGAGMIINSVKRWMNTESNERETMSAGKLIASLSLGTLAIIFPVIIALGHNTLWGSDPISAQEFSSFALDGSIAQQSAMAIREGPGRYVPGAALVAFYGILILIGSISIYMGIKDAWIAINYGNDMYGTSMPFKTGKVLGHLIFGLGLIFINDTQCMMVLTFGGTDSMCW